MIHEFPDGDIDPSYLLVTQWSVHGIKIDILYQSVLGWETVRLR